MHIDDLVTRIRRLPSAKRKKLDEIVRALEEGAPEAVPAGATDQPNLRASLPPIRGLLRDFGPAPSKETIDEARRELWDGFPREDLP